MVLEQGKARNRVKNASSTFAKMILQLFCISLSFSLSLSLTLAAPDLLVVAQDGLGDFSSIMDAVNAVPDYSPNRTTIKIKAGIYNEFVFVSKEKLNLMFIGEGVDSTRVIGNKSNIEGIRISESATLAIEGDGFLAQDITIENTAGPEARQAVAVQISSDYSAFYRCRIVGFQDTLYTKAGIQFFRDCEIYGTVDFIFGHARVVLQHCNIYGRQPIQGQAITVTAQNRNSLEISGIVIQSSIITATVELQNSLFPVKVYLGRPWSNYSTTVIMHNYLDTFIDPVGWLDWDNRSALDTIKYIEYANQGPGADTSRRVSWKGFEVPNNLVYAAQFTAREFIDGASWIPSTGFPCDLDLGPTSSLGADLIPSFWLLLLGVFLYIVQQMW
ncbi:pectinesterase-like [Argentina anserina]|uniref:pectinesterase-like n=1 Tax=Argentina anserina TaxID=57926 RepID=UPI0021765C9A|nr:pectinesterase-like [Potentilla anserina]